MVMAGYVRHPQSTFISFFGGIKLDSNSKKIKQNLIDKIRKLRFGKMAGYKETVHIVSSKK